MTIILLSFVIERALALVFESKLYINTLGGKDLKPLIALLVSFGICSWVKFDAMSVLFGSKSNSIIEIICYQLAK